jgi:phage tail-like protein
MARGQALDYLHNMRFSVAAVENYVPLNTINAQAGFSACTTPEATIEVVEYKEGQFLYVRKYPGQVTYNDITMSRGVARTDSSFWQWLRTVIEGTGEYRTELLIKHFHRSDTLPGPSDPPAENLNLQVPAKIYKLWQALPVRHKFSSDLDATDSGVSIMELDVAYEHCELIEP